MEIYTLNQLANIKRSARVMKNTNKLSSEWYDVILNLCDHLIHIKETLPKNVQPKSKPNK